MGTASRTWPACYVGRGRGSPEGQGASIGRTAAARRPLGLYWLDCWRVVESFDLSRAVLALAVEVLIRQVGSVGSKVEDRSMPTICSPYAGELPARDKIPDIYTPGYLLATERHLRFATAGLGVRLSPGATILDFGCGIGSSVRGLLAQGYNAFGVDVLEYWDRDFDKYWLIGDKPPPEITERLKLADPATYRL